MASVKCICHVYSKNPGNEVQFTDISWAKLCESAKRRRDHIYDKLRTYIDGTLQLPLATNIVRHVNCYKVYTLPKSILLMERKRTLEDASEPEGQPSHEFFNTIVFTCKHKNTVLAMLKHNTRDTNSTYNVMF